MKQCPRCKQEKLLVNFPTNAARKNGRGTYCLPCQRTYTSEHYRLNKASYIQRTGQNKEKFRKSIQALKNRPCADCKQVYDPHAMDFDHVRGEKLFNVGEGTGRGNRIVLAEIAKCEIVCANCHRLRTKRRLENGSVA